MAHRLHKERKVRLTTPMAVTYYNLRIDTSLCAVTFKFSSTSRRVGLELLQITRPQKAHWANFRLAYLLLIACV